MPKLPKTPEQLRDTLFKLFPPFQKHCASDVEPADGAALTHHSILQDFTVFFGAEIEGFSTDQLRSLGTLVSAAVEEPGPLENAFGTCFLEHLHQVHALRRFRPFLSKVARQKTHA